MKFANAFWPLVFVGALWCSYTWATASALRHLGGAL